MSDFGKVPTWAVVELFGHIRHAGLVQEASVLGVAMGRVDVPDAKEPGKWHATHYFAGSAIFRLTPCTEEFARKVAAESQGVWTTYQLAEHEGGDDEPDLEGDGETEEEEHVAGDPAVDGVL